HRTVFMNLVTRGPMLRLDVACPVAQLALRPQTVSVLIDGVLVKQVTLETRDWNTIDIPVGSPLGSIVLVQLRTSYTFHQSTMGTSTDTRRVGVLLKPARWLGPSAAGNALSPVLQQIPQRPLERYLGAPGHLLLKLRRIADENRHVGRP